MTTWSAVTWDTARAGGFVAYVLLTLAVSAGLVLRNRWQTSRWPRLVTNEVHGYLSLLALVFIVVHVLAVLVDPFTRFRLGEVLLPFASHYRPLWMGLGTVALYLLLAVWISSKLRSRIGYRTWRGIHVLAYGVYGAATVHGLGTGSDTQTVWAAALYAGSVLLVAALTARRLLVPPGRSDRPRPVVASVGALTLAVVAAWAVVGPFAPHWGSRAGGTSGTSSRSTTRLAIPRAHARITSQPASGVVSLPFRARFTGSLEQQPVDASGRITIRIDGALHGGTRDHLEIYLRGVPLEGGGVAMEQSRVRMGAATALYTGEIVALRGSELIAELRSEQQRLRLGIALDLSQGTAVRGSVRGEPARGASA
jgi:DMSO/TMAO reductase YedYZ heme-binding membrane subunit